MCDYQATQQFCLKQHMKTKHEGVRYDCNMCDYQATQKSALRCQKMSSFTITLTSLNIQQGDIINFHS